MKKVAVASALVFGTLGTTLVLLSVGSRVAGLYLVVVLTSAIGGYALRGTFSYLSLAVFWLSLLPTVWLVGRMILISYDNLHGAKSTLEDYGSLLFLAACALYLSLFAYLTFAHLVDWSKVFRK